MIRKTFLLLDKVGKQKEKGLWLAGISDWDSFLAKAKIPSISGKAKISHDRQLLAAKQALYAGDSAFFVSLIPLAETWRLYNSFKDEAVFIDIETSGVRGRLTMITLFDGFDTKTMVAGVNLDTVALKRVLAGYRLIVTYNGNSFDLPFLRKLYPGLVPDVPCIDLRHLCQRLGLTGGLKAVEKSLGIKRDSIIEKMYGGDPYLLYRKWMATGDEYFLKLLVQYNEDDTISLKKIAEYCCDTLGKEINKQQIPP